MNHSMLTSALFATVFMAACDKPTVVAVPTPAPAPAVAVPGPAGPAGPQGATGSQGNPGKPGDTTIVMPPPAASAPTN